MEKEETALILKKLALLSNDELLLEELNPYIIQYLLSQLLFSKTNHLNNINRLNILCSIIYNYYIKIEWKRQIINIIDNKKWLEYNYIYKLNACMEYIEECKKDLIEIYLNLIKQERICYHRYVTVYDNNIFSTCCCGELDCSIVQLIDNINIFKLI